MKPRSTDGSLAAVPTLTRSGNRLWAWAAGMNPARCLPYPLHGACCSSRSSSGLVTWMCFRTLLRSTRSPTPFLTCEFSLRGTDRPERRGRIARAWCDPIPGMATSAASSVGSDWRWRLNVLSTEHHIRRDLEFLARPRAPVLSWASSSSSTSAAHVSQRRSITAVGVVSRWLQIRHRALPGLGRRLRERSRRPARAGSARQEPRRLAAPPATRRPRQPS